MKTKTIELSPKEQKLLSILLYDVIDNNIPTNYWDNNNGNIMSYTIAKSTARRLDNKIKELG